MIAPQNSRSNAEFPEKPVRLLLVAPSLRILGGQAVQANYLLENLSREPMFEVSFVPHNPRFPGPFRLLQKIKYVRTLATSLVYCINLLLKIPRHDIIHVFSASYLSFLLAPTPAIFIGRLFGKKVILNYHSGEAEDHLRCWPRTSVPIMKLADELIVPSPYLAGVFRKFGLQAHAISNVVDQEQFNFRERKPLRPIFLSNRNLYLLYNVACTLRAFARIQQRFPEAKLIVAGGGRQRPYLESLASELKLQNVEFRGLVSPGKMNALYDEADIYLNSSNIDNMPGSIIESFACGLPVVSTNAGGIRYIVTHGRTGLLVPKNDFEAMASWAIRLLETPELAESIARNAYEECPAYTWPAVRETWVAAYLRLVGVRPRSTQIYADQIS
ncbi:MAG TPA: glycosyltransferase family 4 protein [Pyrinomonadaceae bacterium]|nr:glycosyltransferase family 4 protein [Pyrinomonadaceae bacterium]